MKQSLLKAFTIGITALLVACSTTSVTTDWDRTVDFSQYSTFTLIKEQQPAPNPLMRQRVEEAVARELVARGFQQVDRDGDLLVAIHGYGGVHRRVDVDHYGYGYRWRGWGMGGASVNVTDIPMGTVIVDLAVATTKELEWRGMITDSVSKNPDKNWAKLEKGIAKMFAGFPPGQ